MAEPTITINGRKLSEGQATTVRVAVSSWRMRLEDPAEPAERVALGPISAAYAEHLAAIEDMIFDRAPR